MRFAITKIAVLAASCAMLLSACSPSAQYQQGQGFYSEQYSQSQVDALEKAGKVKTVAQFSVDKKSCLNYSAGMTDRNLVIPAAQEGLRKWYGNAASQISAKEEWYDNTIGVMLMNVLPLALGCKNLEVSENVLKVTP
ncbi:MAG TPA: hypothetical protein VMU16_12375 [Candidatus Binataceae bacterium]|nr:hypothetical protein [Candidatus Binataceae bacterium]